MNMIDWYKKVLQKYAVFEGRARRSEYWYFALVNFIIGIILGLADGALGLLSIGIADVYSLAILIPSIAVGVRRLHDTDRSGWWWLIAFTGIGIFVLIYFFAQEGQKRF